MMTITDRLRIWPRAGWQMEGKPRMTWRDESGIALIEFALIIPVLIVLLLGMIEFGEIFIVDRRVTAAASSAADLVARTDVVSDEQLNDIGLAVREILKPFPDQQLGIVITSVIADEDNSTTVGWSWSHGTGVSARAEGDQVTLPNNLTEPHSSVIMAEVRYPFSPTVGLFVSGGTILEATSYFRPRLSTKVEKN